MHLPAFRFVDEMAQKYGAKGPIYEIGSRNINGSVRVLFTDLQCPYHGIDLAEGRDVDAVANAATYTPPMTPETVVCCEVLEHTPEVARIVQQAVDVLAPGGLVILTMAGPGRAPHSAIDGGPLHEGEHYANISIAQLYPLAEAAGLDTLCLMMSSDGVSDLYYAGRKRSTT